MSIKYQMWLTHNAEQDKIQLPVLPQSFQTKNGSSNSSVSIAGLGELLLCRAVRPCASALPAFFRQRLFPVCRWPPSYRLWSW